MGDDRLEDERQREEIEAAIDQVCNADAACVLVSDPPTTMAGVMCSFYNLVV